MYNLKDKELERILNSEYNRQVNDIELIASENYVSQEVLKVMGSHLTNKYAEGYPNKRYYGGTKYIDQAELLAIERLKKIFHVKYANVQPHSGSQANAAALMVTCKPGDTIMGLSLDSGGHLSHGHFLSFSGHFYKPIFYHLNQDGLLDYQKIEEIALKEKPKAIICGYSAYSKIIDFAKFREISDKIGAYLIADIAHIAGLIATNNYPSPVGYAHIITSTTHKTLRGPRGGIIMTNDDELAPKIDKAVFPGQQGGPLMHIIAAKAQAFGEVLTDKFKTYCTQIIKNAKAFAKVFIDNNIEVISNGTDSHLFIINVKKSFNLTGIQAEKILEKQNIIVNKNTIPNDLEKPYISSGVRLGVPAMTTRGFKEKQFQHLAKLIIKVLSNPDINVLDEVKQLTKEFPIPKSFI